MASFALPVLPLLAYDCDGCGACCRSVFIFAEPLDVLREPMIAELATATGTLPLREMTWDMVDHKGCRCVFLGDITEDDNRCRIYNTRPSCCVGFQAGSAECQRERKREGLPLLRSRPAQGVLDELHAVLR